MHPIFYDVMSMLSDQFFKAIFTVLTPVKLYIAAIQTMFIPGLPGGVCNPSFWDGTV